MKKRNIRKRKKKMADQKLFVPRLPEYEKDMSGSMVPSPEMDKILQRLRQERDLK